MTTPSRSVVSEGGQIHVSDPSLQVEYSIWGNAPVQGDGTVAGRELYFRARHDAWSFDIADHKGALPSDGRADPDGFYREGESVNASWMPLEEAMQIIDQCLSEYLQRAEIPRLQDGEAERPFGREKQEG